jgi:hypothetical protein
MFTVVEVPAAAAVVGISNGTCHKILFNDLTVPHVTQRSVPCILTQDQHNDCMNTYTNLNDNAVKDGTFLHQIITGYKTWWFLHNPQMK